MDPADVLRGLRGEVLTACAASWHEYRDERSDDTIDLWLTFTTRTVNIRGSGGGQDLDITLAAVGEGCDMEEYGRIVVDPGTPREVAARIGERLDGADRLVYGPWGPSRPVGWVLHFSGGSVAFANLCDENWVTAWPVQNDARFTEIEIWQAK